MAQAPCAQYRLKVTAGTENDSATHQEVEVNGQTNTLVGDWSTANVAVRVQNYHGSPSSSPRTSTYFNHPLHRDDLISISFSIVFHHDINGSDLVFGNDFDYPIRHKLPNAFKVMEMVVKKHIDPSIEIDAYSDTPSIFSPVLASASQFRISFEDPPENCRLHHHDIVLEGFDTRGGQEIFKRHGIPGTAKDRRAHFQNQENRERFCFFRGVQYCADFSNAYLNVTDLCLNLPGYPWPVHHLVDSETHELRYTLKDKLTGQIFLVVLFSLDLNEAEASNFEGELKEDTEQWKRTMRGWLM
ncbi:hypothetical protein N7478_010400 [Penicillium angulare]|uniref:uncharacterized protein n=1 Tax=Penicillium angulare TaxID=116970 RepID=UPI0025416F10|nr:uncharacterized protein N7478_010400 [Penicillium angulare]KAJ5267592.1 hypothetical protein N7478_010400 [Penicillium angulare]